MRVAALTTGRNDPSARFRGRQHIAALGALGVNVREYVPRIDKHAGLPTILTDAIPLALHPVLAQAWVGAKLAARVPGALASTTAYLIWLNRELIPGRYTLERFLIRPYVLDIDDAVWRGRPNGAATMVRLARRARAVIAGNQVIADWFSSYARDVHIVPTAIDTDRFVPRVNTPGTRRYSLGWTGSSGNFDYLYAIEMPLVEFLERFDARFIVVADRAPEFSQLSLSRIDYRPWTEHIEATVLTEMDVGLMPLLDKEWTRGKYSFKMRQYMEVGLPTIVSPVGMNQDVLEQSNLGLPAVSQADWYEALLTLHNSADLSAAKHQKDFVFDLATRCQGIDHIAFDPTASSGQHEK